MKSQVGGGDHEVKDIEIRCIKCSVRLKKGDTVVLPFSAASWLTGKQTCQVTQYAACRPCARLINTTSPFGGFRNPEIGLPFAMNIIAQYVPETSQIVPFPKMAIDIDHDVHEDGQIRAVMAFSHEYIHFWLHKQFDYLTSVQFDNISPRLDDELCEILRRNFPHVGRIGPQREQFYSRLKHRLKQGRESFKYQTSHINNDVGTYVVFVLDMVHKKMRNRMKKRRR